MIKKPAEWDSVSASRGGGMDKLPAGNYECSIVRTTTELSRDGNLMLVLAVDITDGEYGGYFRSKYENSVRFGEPRWDNGGIYKQNTEGKGVPYFKGLIEVLQESNDGFRWNWDERTLVGLTFAGQFREEEFEYNGRMYTKTRLAFIRPIAELDTLPVLEKKSQRPASTVANNNFGSVPFGDVPPPADEDIPF